MTRDLKHQDIGAANNSIPAKLLYLAHFEKRDGKITLPPSDDQPISGEQPITLHGELLIAGKRNQDQTILFDEVRYLSFWSEEVRGLKSSIALAGSSSDIQLSENSYGEARLKVRLYYNQLSQLAPAYEEDDAVYPPLEVFEAKLTWEPTGVGSDNSINARITLTLEEKIVIYVRAITNLTFGPSELSFQLAKGQAKVNAQANSLSPCTGSAPAGSSATQRQLNLRFINLSRRQTPIQVEDIVKKSISGACGVWWEKGGIRLNPELNMITPSPSPAGYNGCLDGLAGFCVSLSEEATLNTISPANNVAEVYMVDQLIGDGNHPRQSGGVAYNCRTTDAYIILEINKAANNIYLLAHELGHILGLTHPTAIVVADDNVGLYSGSACSVMAPSRPASKRNTQSNMMTAAAAPLGPVLTTPVDASNQAIPCSLAPDVTPFFFIIRSDPYDDGFPQVAGLGTSADVWNSKNPPSQSVPDKYEDPLGVLSDIFAPDYSPNHTDPDNTQSTYYMYVRLHACQSLSWPIAVYLYLVAPGQSLIPLTNTTVPFCAPIPSSLPAPHLCFSGLYAPQPGFPKTQSVPWSIPAGYQGQATVFAVAVSNEDSFPPGSAVLNIINNPASVANAVNVFSNLALSSPKVAQRNFNLPPQV